MKMENFLGTKSWKKILEELKRKVNIFIRTKNILNPCFYYIPYLPTFDRFIEHSFNLVQLFEIFCLKEMKMSNVPRKKIIFWPKQATTIYMIKAIKIYV